MWRFCGDFAEIFTQPNSPKPSIRANFYLTWPYIPPKAPAQLLFKSYLKVIPNAFNYHHQNNMACLNNPCPPIMHSKNPYFTPSKINPYYALSFIGYIITQPIPIVIIIKTYLPCSQVNIQYTI